MSAQLARAVVRIREMILRGEIAPGQRVTEEGIAETLGLSRTPVRQALPLLAHEGLLIEHETRGYVARAFTAADIVDAIEMRGALEGLATRRVCEQGASKNFIRLLRACLDDGDRILSKHRIEESDEALYAEMNVRFHALIINETASPILAEALERNHRVPFAGPQAIAFDKNNLDQMYAMLHYAHRQHHEIVHALEHGQSARVEFLMREHAHTVKSSINMEGFEIAVQNVPRIAVSR